MRRSSKHANRGRAALLCGITIGLAAATAAADHDSAYAADDTWFVEITHMPDLDQVRTDLPGGGAAYCVPTAAMNLFTYFALHGSNSPPGVANWRSFDGHTTMTGLLNILGQAMGTHPVNGTQSDEQIDGYDAWLPDGRFTILSFMIDGGWNPRHQHVGVHSALYGGYCNLGVGWYSGGGTDITRSGGHAVTVVEAARSGSDMTIGIRDPASDDGAGWMQSPYTTETYSVSDVSRRPTLDGQQLDARTMSRLNGYGNDTVTGYIDGMVVVTPQFALAALPNDGYVIHRQAVIEDGRDMTIEFAPFQERRICRAVYGSDGRIMFFLCPIDSEQLAEIQIGHPGGEFEIVEPKGGGFPALVDAVPGLGQAMFVLDKEHGLVEFDTDAMSIEASRQIPFQTHMDDMALDEPEDTGGRGYVWAIAVRDSVIVRVDADDIGHGSLFVLEVEAAWNLPLGLQIEPLPGRYGAFLGWKRGDARIWRLQVVGEILRTLEERPMPWVLEGVSIDDVGRVLMTGEGTIHEYAVNESGELEPAEDPRFDGLASAGAVLLSRSWIEFDPELHVGPAWNHVLPTNFGESEEDCLADFDFDGRVGVRDLLTVLSAWGTDHPYADIAPDGGDGVVGLADLLALLSAWGDCR